MRFIVQPPSDRHLAFAAIDRCCEEGGNDTWKDYERTFDWCKVEGRKVASA